MTDEEMRASLRQLEQALYNHDQWAEALYGTLICRLDPDERDIAEEPHRRCRFGQWVYGPEAVALQRQPGFQEVGIEHERMHQFAAGLLCRSLAGAPIPIADYERFLSALKRLRLEILTLKREIEEALFNLDPLTGTPSRIGMLTKLRELQQLVKRGVFACCVAMADIDRFKRVNDGHGHLVGDQVLITIAHYMMRCLRPYDTVFRYAGDEFLLCLPDTDATVGNEILDRLRQGLVSLPHPADDNVFVVTVSFGLATLDPNLPVEESVDRADKALYAAKRNGGNRTVIWDSSMAAANSGLAFGPERGAANRRLRPRLPRPGRAPR